MNSAYESVFLRRSIGQLRTRLDGRGRYHFLLVDFISAIHPSHLPCIDSVGLNATRDIEIFRSRSIKAYPIDTDSDSDSDVDVEERISDINSPPSSSRKGINIYYLTI